MNDRQKNAAYTTLAILVAFAIIALVKWGYARYQQRKLVNNANAGNGTKPTTDDDLEEAEPGRTAQ